MRDANTKRKATDGYYTKTTEEREAWDKTNEDEEKKTKATLIAAWTETNKPAAGEEGSACSATKKCTGAGHCCGTATPKSSADGDEITGVCASKTAGTFTSGLGIAYTHVCGAKSLLAGAATLAAMTYLM